MEEFRKVIADLREKCLFGEYSEIADGLDCFAELEYLQALDFLQLAERAIAKAVLHQTRALAQSPYR